MKSKIIKLTLDGRYHSMGLVVDTLDEAIERCERKGRGANIHVVVPGDGYEFGLCGTPEFIREALDG